MRNIVFNWYQALPKRWLVILLSLLILNYFGYINKSLQFAGKSYIDSYNYAYIESVEKQSIKSFLVISATLSTLAILKSSSAGFSFIFDMDIQYGNLFQSLYLLVEKGWNASFIALATIEIIKGFLNYSYKLSAFFLGGFLFIELLNILLINLNKRVLEFLLSLRKIFLFLAITTYILVPIYVAGMGLVSQNISHPLNQEINQNLQNLNDDLTPLMPEKITKKPAGYKNMIDSFNELKEDIINSSKVLIKHSIAAIITAIFIPLTFLIFIFLSFRLIFINQATIKLKNE